MCKLLETVFEIVLNPLDLLTGGLLSNYNLNPFTTKFKQSRNDIGNKIIELFRKLKQQDNVKSNTFLGGMVNYNKQHPEDQITDREIIGNIFLFVVASQDTTRISTGWALHFLGNDKAGQEILREEALSVNSINIVPGKGDNNVSFEKLEDSPILAAQIKEGLRVGAPFVTTDFREMTKNTKIGDLTLKKGENVLIALNINHFKEAEFKDAFKFDRSRFLAKNSYKRQNNAAFGHGARACIGKSMAETNIKIIILKFLEHFEFEYLKGEDNFSDVADLIPFYTLQKVNLRLRLRK